MRSTSGPTSITLAKSAILVAILFVMAPALYAQSDEVLYLGNTRTVQPDIQAKPYRSRSYRGGNNDKSLLRPSGPGRRLEHDLFDREHWSYNRQRDSFHHRVERRANQCQYRWDGYFCPGCVGSLRRHPDTDRQSGFGDRSVEDWLGQV